MEVKGMEASVQSTTSKACASKKHGQGCVCYFVLKIKRIPRNFRRQSLLIVLPRKHREFSVILKLPAINSN